MTLFLMPELTTKTQLWSPLSLWSMYRSWNFRDTLLNEVFLFFCFAVFIFGNKTPLFWSWWFFTQVFDVEISMVTSRVKQIQHFWAKDFFLIQNDMKQISLALKYIRQSHPENWIWVLKGECNPGCTHYIKEKLGRESESLEHNWFYIAGCGTYNDN